MINTSSLRGVMAASGLDSSSANNANTEQNGSDLPNPGNNNKNGSNHITQARAGAPSLSGIEAFSRQATTTDTLREASTGLDNLQKQLNSSLKQEPQGAPSDATDLHAAITGITGAYGRESAVQDILTRAYKAGQEAPQTAYEGTMHRGVGSDYADGSLSFEHSSTPQRYNGPGQFAIYGGVKQADAIHELSVYPIDKSRTYTKFSLSITPDPKTGVGGVANISEGLASQKLPDAVLAQRDHNPSITERVLHKITGEHPYHAPQQAAKGAQDAGAAAMLTPSSLGGSQLNILPANANPSSITPVDRQARSPSGVFGPVENASTVADMPAPSKSSKSGQLEFPAGHSGHPVPVDPKPGEPASDKQKIKYVQTRANSVRFGVAGTLADTLAQTGLDVANGKSIDAAQIGQTLAVDTVVGGAATWASDFLPNKLGKIPVGPKTGGAVVAGFVQIGASGYTNYRHYSDGNIGGARATANTLVDTTAALAVGATGAYAGATVGTMIMPALGTAGGAAVGFVAGVVVGVGVQFALQAVDSVTDLTSSAKNGLTSVFKWFGG